MSGVTDNTNNVESTGAQTTQKTEQSDSTTGSNCVELVTCIKTERDSDPVVDCKITSGLSVCGVNPGNALNTAELPVTVAFPDAVTSVPAVKTADSGHSEIDCSSQVKWELKDCYVSSERLDPRSSGNEKAVRNVVSYWTTPEAVSVWHDSIDQSHVIPFHDERAALMQDYLAEKTRLENHGEQTLPDLSSPNTRIQLTCTDEKRFTCSICGSSFSQPSYLRRHERVHTGGRKHKCKVCGAAFMQRHHLRDHELVHTGERLFKCAVCGYSSSRPSRLRDHEKNHTDEKPFTCAVCGFSFRRSCDLRRHKVTHTGEKPHVCNTCGLAFTRHCNLRKHQFLHTGEKPHVCNTCGFSFARVSDLRIHEFLHTGEKPHKCNTCGSAFAERRQLRRHEFRHTGERPHMCNTCGFAFTDRCALRRHVRLHNRKMSLKSVTKIESKIDGVDEFGEVVSATEVIEGESNQLPSGEGVEPKVEKLYRY